MRRVRWSELDASARDVLLRRPAQSVAVEVSASVASLIDAVRRDGDAALRALTLRFDGADLDAFAVPPPRSTSPTRRYPMR